MLAQLVRGSKATLVGAQQNLGRAKGTGTEDNNVSSDEQGSSGRAVLVQESFSGLLLPLEIDDIGRLLLGLLLGVLDTDNIAAGEDLSAMVPCVGNVVHQGGVLAPVVDAGGIVAGEGRGLLVDTSRVERILEVDCDRWADKLVVYTSAFGLGLECGELGKHRPVLWVWGGFQHVAGVLEGLVEQGLVLSDLLWPDRVVPDARLWLECRVGVEEGRASESIEVEVDQPKRDNDECQSSFLFCGALNTCAPFIRDE